jgi:beta-lactamase regulating signal transducer with metallopeptidase domain
MKPADAPAAASASPGSDAADAPVAPAPIPRGVYAAWLAASLTVLAALGAAQLRLRRECGPCVARRVEGAWVLVSGRAGPMVLGVVEPRIVLPRWAVDGPADELRIILRHEREHVRAGDAWLLALSALAVAAMPWSIPLWWQHRRLRLAVETDCDARVLSAGESPADYGRVLLRTAGRRFFPPAPVLAWCGTRSHLERRIIAMTARRPRHAAARALPLAAAAISATLAACAAATSGVADGAAAGNETKMEAFDGRLARTDLLADGTYLTVMGPVPGWGTTGLSYRFGDQPRTRSSPPPVALPVVSWIARGSSAEKAGLREGDVLVSANGRDMREPWAISPERPGTVYTLRFRRGGEERETRLVVGPPPTRAEAERHMAMESACLRRARTGPAGPEKNARLSQCSFPY